MEPFKKCRNLLREIGVVKIQSENCGEKLAISTFAVHSPPASLPFFSTKNYLVHFHPSVAPNIGASVKT
jgi:hypothetical protein